MQSPPPQMQKFPTVVADTFLFSMATSLPPYGN
jgi:hypothetical protein